MLQSVTRMVLFLALVAALAWGASLLLQLPGGVRIALGTVELNLGPLQALVLLVLGFLALWLLLRLLGLALAVVRFLNGDETALSRHFHRRRQGRGLRALSDSLLALAGGQGTAALTQARKAARLLQRPELTGPLLAQAAEAAGAAPEAEAAWKELLGHDRSRYAALRGLMRARLENGERATALELARRAFALRPEDAALQDTLLTLQVEAADWAGARRTLEQKGRQGLLPRDVIRRREAVLTLAEAQALAPLSAEASAAPLPGGKAGTSALPPPAAGDRLREAATRANRLAPGLVPAAVLAADGLRAEGKTRAAAKVLRRAWAEGPHPDLAAAFARLAPDEGPEARLRRFEALTGTRAEESETRLLRAELLIAAGDFPEARRVAAKLVEQDPSARAFALMAAISRGEAEAEAITRGWLARAMVAPRGPQWCCENCGQSYEAWRPVCNRCGGLDTLAWRRSAREGSGTMPGAAEMLPLIVGTAPAEVSGDASPASAPGTDRATGASSDPEPPPATSDPGEDGENTGRAPS